MSSLKEMFTAFNQIKTHLVIYVERTRLEKQLGERQTLQLQLQSTMIQPTADPSVSVLHWEESKKDQHKITMPEYRNNAIQKGKHW